MTETIGTKIRGIFLGDTHALLDKVIDMNSIAYVKQHARDLDEAIMQVKQSDNQALGHNRILALKRTELTNRIAELDHTCDILISQGKDDLAAAKQVELDQAQKELDNTNKEYDNTTETIKRYEQTISVMMRKHDEMLARVSELESLERTRKAQEKATHAQQVANELLDEGVNASVDNILNRAREKAATADVAFEQTFTVFQNQQDQDTAVILAKSKIEERKKKLAAKN